MTSVDLSFNRPRAEAPTGGRLQAHVNLEAGPRDRADSRSSDYHLRAGKGDAQKMSDIVVGSWGAGTPVVLVHGSLATGAEEWQAQRPLADEGFRLVVPDRRGYGRSPAADGEDFLRDADDIVALMGDGAHLVGHSYGGLGALFAPSAVRSRHCLWPCWSRLHLRWPSTIWQRGCL